MRLILWGITPLLLYLKAAEVVMVNVLDCDFTVEFQSHYYILFQIDMFEQ